VNSISRSACERWFAATSCWAPTEICRRTFRSANSGSTRSHSSPSSPPSKPPSARRFQTKPGGLAFDRTRNVVLERSLEGRDLPRIDPPPGVELRPYDATGGEDLTSLWPAGEERRARRDLRRALQGGSIALAAVETERVLALDLLSDAERTTSGCARGGAPATATASSSLLRHVAEASELRCSPTRFRSPACGAAARS
jgi:hypothetical protein